MKKPYFMEYISDDVVWVFVPTFHFFDEAQKATYEDVLKNIPDLRTIPYIIFDIRGNGGGNSYFGSQIIDALCGEEYSNAKRAAYTNREYVDWRATAENIKHVEDIIKRYPDIGFEVVRDGMKQSLERGEPFYKETDPETPIDQKSKSLLSKKTKIIVVIDRYNVSAALDFIDQLKMVTSQITLFGETTKFDRVYMELRSVDLPSGAGTLHFPIKVYRNRPRKDKERYVPDFSFDQIDDNRAVQEYIMCELVKK